MSLNFPSASAPSIEYVSYSPGASRPSDRLTAVSIGLAEVPPVREQLGLQTPPAAYGVCRPGLCDEAAGFLRSDGSAPRPGTRRKSHPQEIAVKWKAAQIEPGAACAVSKTITESRRLIVRCESAPIRAMDAYSRGRS